MLRKRIYAWKNRGMALLLAGITAFGMTAVPAFAEEQTETEAAMQSVLPNGREVYNVLLIGSDRRNDSWNGNSDVMIVMSVNAGSKKLSLTSFMRDLYADIPGYGVHKLNYAYAAGGAKTLMATLEDNYELSIDNYAVVDFETMAKVVDLVGGVEIEVSDAECKVLNDYLTSMNAADDYLPGGGSYVLNGNQAVAYMRIRYVGNNDYERTQRQRDVLGVIFASMQKLDAEQLTKLVDEILPNVENDITPVDMIRLMAHNPIVFPMANPVPEIMPEEALRGGAAVVGTGRSDYDNQINNVLAFPGIFRGALDVRARDINDEMKMAASRAIASLVSDEELTPRYILPEAFDRRVGPAVARAVAEAAVRSGVARLPLPDAQA